MDKSSHMQRLFPFNVWKRVREHEIAALAILCLLIFVFALSLAPKEPLIGGNSIQFMDFYPERTAGYPIFLNVVRLFDSNLHTLPILQLVILCSSTFLFSIGVARVTGRFYCAVAAIVFLLGNYDVVKYCFWVLSDGPFISLLAAFLGAFALSLSTRPASSLWIAAASTLLGAATSVRPDGIALLIMFSICYAYAWQAGEYRAGTLVLMLAPASVVVFLSLAAYHERYGTWAPDSLFGLNLLSRAAVLADGTEPSARPAWDRIVADVAAKYKEQLLIGGAWSDRALLNTPVYNGIRHSLGLLHGENPVIPTQELGTGATKDHALTELALHIIRAHKIEYIQEVALNYFAFWYIPELLSDHDLARIQRTIATYIPSSDIGNVIPKPRPWPLVIFVRLFQMCVFAISVAFLIALPIELALHRKPHLFVWLGFATSLTLHASILVAAALVEMKPRYVMDKWPLEVLLAVLAIAAAISPVSQSIYFFARSKLISTLTSPTKRLSRSTWSAWR
jgi:hypothetical protein